MYKCTSACGSFYLFAIVRRAGKLYRKLLMCRCMIFAYQISKIMTSNLRVVRFINNKTPCHYIVKSLLSCSKSNHEKSYAEDKPGKYLPKVATRCLSERYTLARQISNYYSKSHFAESRLFRRTFHDCLINPNKQKTQNETKNIIIGKSSKLCFASENIIGNSEYKTKNKATDRHDKRVYDKSGKSFPKASVTKSCIFCFHRIKKFSSLEL